MVGDLMMIKQRGLYLSVCVRARSIEATTSNKHATHLDGNAAALLPKQVVTLRALEPVDAHVRQHLLW